MLLPRLQPRTTIKRTRRLALLYGLVCLVGCHGGNHERPPASLATVPVPGPPHAGPTPAFPFAVYLRQRFGQTVPASEHWYVVIPAVGCTGCGADELRYLAAGPAHRPAVTVVASTLVQKLTSRERRLLAKKTILLADTLAVANNVLDRLNLPFPTLTGVVHTRPGHAPEYLPFDNDTYRSVFAKLPQE